MLVNEQRFSSLDEFIALCRASVSLDIQYIRLPEAPVVDAYKEVESFPLYVGCVFLTSFTDDVRVVSCRVLFCVVREKRDVAKVVAYGGH